MGMLDRYKKKGGFLQLLILVETSGKAKQEQFLNLIGQESPRWEEALRQKMLSFDRILGWDASYLREVLTRVQPLTLVTSLKGLAEPRRAVVMAILSGSEQRKLQQMMDEANPTPAEIGTAVFKVVTETRHLIVSGILKIDKIESELLVPDHIEELLHHEPVAHAATAAPPEELVYETPVAEPKSSSIEMESLKRKIHQLNSENTNLKTELNTLRAKLDQIRRIA